jgi:chromosome segregation ATPase
MSMPRMALTVVLSLAASSFLLAQRGAGGRSAGAGGPRGTQPTMRESGGPSQQRGSSEQRRQKIQANDSQRKKYRVATRATKQVRTRAGEMVRLAKSLGFDLAGYRTLYASLQNEVQRMAQEHEALMTALSEEQRAATGEAARDIEADLKEIDVWMEAMDDELKEGTSAPQNLLQQARKVEKSAKNLEKQYSKLASELDLEP